MSTMDYGLPVTQPVTVKESTLITSIRKVLSAATVNDTSVKSSPGKLYSVVLSNTSASHRHFKFYNVAGVPAVGTDPVLFTITVPANGHVNVQFAVPVTFTAGIGYAITAGAADADIVAVAANDIVGSLFYI